MNTLHTKKKTRTKTAASVLLSLLLAAAMLLTASCGGGDEPDSSIPESGSASSVSQSDSDPTEPDGREDPDTPTEPGFTQGDGSTAMPTDTPDAVPDGTEQPGPGTGGQGKPTTGKKPTGGGILVDPKTTKATTKGTNPTKPVVNVTNQDKIMAMFTPAMKGKTVSILTHFKKGPMDDEKFARLKKEKGVKVKYLTTELGNYGTRLSGYINAGNSPDVAYMTQNYYPSLVTKGFVQDLTASKVDVNDPLFDKQSMNSFRWNGKQYGLLVKNSKDAYFQVTFYNKSMFARKGVKDPGVLWREGNWNWDTFLECAKAMNDPDSDVWGCDLYYAHKFLPSAGVGIVTVGDGKITNNITDKRIVSAWTFVNELHHVHKVTTGLVGSEENFATGKCAMMLGESWQWGRGLPIAKSMKDKWGVVPVPCPKGKPVSLMCARAACTPIGAKNPEAGMALYTYWTSKDMDIEIDDGEPAPTNYSRNELEDMFRTMWGMNKIVDVAEGIYEYGGDYTGEMFSYDVFSHGMSGIQTSINRWKTVIDSNIRRIMTEFS